MKRLLVLAILLLVVTAVGCSQKEDMTKSVEAWIEAAEEVATRSDSKGAINVVKFLKKHSFVIKPLKGGQSDEIVYEVVTQAPDTEYKIAITCLKESDAELGGEWRKALETKNNHAFLSIPDNSESFSLLVLKDKGITETWKGITLIHEASHAVAHASGELRNIKNPDMKNAVNELLTYTLIGQILASLGGDKYQAILEREMERIRADYIKNVPSYSRPDLYQLEMTEIFGAPASQMEAQLRADTLWFDANMKICDLFSDPDEAMAAKLEILVYAHRNRNIM